MPPLDGPLGQLIGDATETIARCAWLALALLIVWHRAWILQRARAARREVAVLAALFVASLAMRLWLPWGPLSFTEAERLDVLWSARPTACGTMCSVPVVVGAARALGASVAGILRVAPALFGALGVAAVYLLARAVGVGAGGAAVGAAVVLGWPAHLHFSTALTFSVEGAALWCLAFAAALAPRGAVPERAHWVAALSLLGVLTRPELRLLLVPLALAAALPRWSWRERGVCAALLGLGMLPYVQFLGASNIARSGQGRLFVSYLWRDSVMNPWWWLYAAALGALAGLARRAQRGSTAVVLSSVLILFVVYRGFSSEPNPRWGQWRYFVTLVPFMGFGVALLADSALRVVGRAGPGLIAALLIAAGGTAAASLGDLRRAEDLSSEFHYVRASAPRVIGAGRRDVLVLSNGGQPARRNVRPELLPSMALATRFGPLSPPVGCDARPSSGITLRDLELVTEGCPQSITDESVVYLGLSRERARIAEITRRFSLVPIEERALRVALTSWVVNRQATERRGGEGNIEGLRAPDDRVRLGWYRLIPR